MSQKCTTPFCVGLLYTNDYGDTRCDHCGFMIRNHDVKTDLDDLIPPACPISNCTGNLHLEGSGLLRCDSCVYVTRKKELENNPVIEEDDWNNSQVPVTEGEFRKYTEYANNDYDQLKDLIGAQSCRISILQERYDYLNERNLLIGNVVHEAGKTVSRAMDTIKEYQLVIDKLNTRIDELQDTVECLTAISSPQTHLTEEEIKW